MNSKGFKYLVALGLVVAGMVGLYLKIEYSGWVVFVGLLGFL